MNINVGLLNLLTIVFVVLKLVGVIAWSWCLVLLPTIIWLIWLTIIVSFVLSLLSLASRLVKKVETETDNQDKSAEDLFKEIEKKLKRKCR